MPNKDPEHERTRHREAKRRQRAVALEVWQRQRMAVIEARPRWPVEDLCYAAGMFEGEGTATIGSGGKHYSVCHITLTNTDMEIIDFFEERWPSSQIIFRAPRNERQAPQWCWKLNGDRAVWFIRDVGPYLRRTSMKAKFAIVEEAQLLRRRGSTTHLARVEELHQQIRLLNRRGPRAESA